MDKLPFWPKCSTKGEQFYLLYNFTLGYEDQYNSPSNSDYKELYTSN